MAVAEHLVGRAEELGTLDHLLASLDAGGSLAVEVVGEPGIGKTRLLAELRDRAETYGHLVLSGSASELERDLPFGVFVDSLDEYLQGLRPDRLEALDDDVRNGLANVFPSLSGFATSQEALLRHERYRSHRAVRELLERLTATGRSCWCSTTSTGPTRRPSICSVRSSDGLQMPPSWLSLPIGRVTRLSGCRQPSSRPGAPARSSTSSSTL